MSDQLDMPVRQAGKLKTKNIDFIGTEKKYVRLTTVIINNYFVGVIYLKNMVTQFWQDREVEKPGDPVPFSIHENDRAAVREHVVEAIIHAPDPVRWVYLACLIDKDVNQGFLSYSSPQNN